MLAQRPRFRGLVAVVRVPSELRHDLAHDGFHVSEDAREAATLPPGAFTEEAFLRAELATLFRQSWVLIPLRSGPDTREDLRSLADLVARRGARAPFTMLDRPLFLQRDWQGKLRAFPNVCTHAWHTLVQGPDRSKTLACPQHGRQFDAQGRCLGQQGFEECKGFPGPEDHLQAFEVAAWGPLLFASLGAPVRPAKEVLGPVQESLGSLPFEHFQRRTFAGEVREVEGNWKQHVWNYLDAMHIPYVHRKPGGLAEAVDMPSYRTEVHGEAVLQWVYARDPALGFDPEVLPARFRDAGGRRVFALWWFVFPNLALNFYPWGLSVNLWMPVPGRPQRTLFFWHHLVGDEAKYAHADEAWLLRTVDDEDVDALAQVARGVRSGFAPRGRFAAQGEEGPHWFHRKVEQAVFGCDGAAPGG